MSVELETADVDELLNRAQQAVNGVDAVRRFLIDLSSTVAELSSNEASYNRLAIRALEKFG